MAASHELSDSALAELKGYCRSVDARAARLHDHVENLRIRVQSVFDSAEAAEGNVNLNRKLAKYRDLCREKAMSIRAFVEDVPYDYADVYDVPSAKSIADMLCEYKFTAVKKIIDDAAETDKELYKEQMEVSVERAMGQVEVQESEDVFDLVDWTRSFSENAKTMTASDLLHGLADELDARTGAMKASLGSPEKSGAGEEKNLTE